MIKEFSEELSTIDKVDFAAIEAAIFIQNPKATIAIANVVGAVWGFLLKEDISKLILLVTFFEIRILPLISTKLKE